jgi:hypothetical protein
VADLCRVDIEDGRTVVSSPHKVFGLYVLKAA